MRVLILLWCCSSFFACKTANQNAPLKKGIAISKNNPDSSLIRIAFGSCNRQNLPQEMWSYIIQNQPELWIWLGDNIYGDTEDMDLMASKYKEAKSHKAYQDLLATCPVIGTWDDHDYGINDGGKEYSKKKESKDLLLDFLDVPDEAAVRAREGVYQSYSFGQGDKKMKIILLDTRYFRDPLENNPFGTNRNKANATGDILGEAQWNWLEKELSNSDAALHLIASSIQVIPEQHIFEKWANFPAARQRLFDLLVRRKVRNALLLSGDRHIAEISKIKLEGLPYPLYEITASGLTHTWSKTMPPSERNRYREGKLIIDKNFGLMHIDWSKEEPSLRIEIRGLQNRLFLRKRINF